MRIVASANMNSRITVTFILRALSQLHYTHIENSIVLIRQDMSFGSVVLKESTLFTTINKDTSLQYFTRHNDNNDEVMRIFIDNNEIVNRLYHYKLKMYKQKPSALACMQQTERKLSNCPISILI